MTTPPPPAPLIYVSHLPSASSLYASLSQPLGLRYLSASTTFPATLHFGLVTDAGKDTLFSIAQSALPNPQTTHIYLPAPSPRSVQEFYNKSRLVNPTCSDTSIGDTEEGQHTWACTRDLDGNMLEAVYSSRGQRRVRTLETASTEKEAKRVLEWQREVAQSVSADNARSRDSSATESIYRSQAPPARRADSYPVPMRLVRRETVTEHYQPHDSHLRSEHDGPHGGISGKAIMGTILGAAAGAAFAYAMTRSEEPPRPGAGARRASFAGHGGAYTHSQAAPHVESFPARSHITGRGEEARPRYVEYTIARPPGINRAHTTHDMSRMIEERSHVSSPRSSGEHGSRVRSASEHRGPSSRSRFDHPLTIMPPAPAPPTARESSPETRVSHRSRRSHGEKSSHHSSRSKSKSDSKSKSHVSGSHASEGRKSHRSQSSAGRKSRRESSRSRVSVSENEESYTSARSHASESTVKPEKKHSRGGASTATIKVSGDRDRGRDQGRDRDREERRSYISAREIPLPRSVVSIARDVPLPRSVVSVARDVPLPRSVLSVAREVPLPHSVIGGGGGGGYHYAASVAPSDSVSSVGAKRERERLRDRMRVRDRW